MDPLCLYSVASCRRMSNQRPRAAERPSADDDETVEDLVPSCWPRRAPLAVARAAARSLGRGKKGEGTKPNPKLKSQITSSKLNESKPNLSQRSVTT